jgi:hypothetical protein
VSQSVKEICLANMYTDWSRDQVNQYIKSRLTPTVSTILSLKDLPWVSPDVVLTRAFMESEVPFRTQSCIYNRCCGTCTRKCSKRCVQDVINRVAMEALSGSKYGRYIRQLLQDPKNLTYDIMVEAVNEMPVISPMRYAAAAIMTVHPESGIMHRKADPNTGEVLFRNWPETGLCPYAIQRTTVVRRKLYHKETF